MRGEIFARAFAVINKSERAAGAGGADVCIGTVDGKGVVRQQIAGLRGARYLVSRISRLAKVGDAL